MVTVYRGYTIVLNPIGGQNTWLIYQGEEFIAKVTEFVDAWALIDARISREAYEVCL